MIISREFGLIFFFKGIITATEFQLQKRRNE